MAAGVDGEVFAVAPGGDESRPAVWVGVADCPQLMDGVAHGPVVANGDQAHQLLVAHGKRKFVSHLSSHSVKKTGTRLASREGAEPKARTTMGLVIAA